jgi:uncharacterized protein (DUF983 family)
MKGTKIYSVITSTCPVCQTGRLYTNPNPYIISETLEMPERCAHCNTKYKIEPSFFYGAMYVSYGVGIAFAVAAFVLSFFVLNLDKLGIFITIACTLIVALPIILRLSRNIWINMFFAFDNTKV